jgi:hypothetical protein
MNVYKCLLIGSGWYVKDWWDSYNERFEFNYVFAMNNALLVTKEKTTHWYIPNDFIYNKNYDLTSFKINNIGLNITSYFLEKPHWYWDPNGGTTVLNCLYDILNRSILNDYKVDLYTIGCDLIYSNNVTHFYGNGTPDPLRLGEDILKKHLTELDILYKSYGCSIKNLSTYKTLLPFDKENISRVCKFYDKYE